MTSEDIEHLLWIIENNYKPEIERLKAQIKYLMSLLESVLDAAFDYDDIDPIDTAQELVDEYNSTGKLPQYAIQLEGYGPDDK